MTRFVPAEASSGTGKKGRSRGEARLLLPTAVLFVLLLLTAAYFRAGDWQSMADPLSSSAWERLMTRSGWDHASHTPAGISADALRTANLRMTGYGQDDSRLGGPIQPDDRVIFTAHTEALGYWRGESKTEYDGKGWRASASDAAGPVAAAAPEPDLSAGLGAGSRTIQQEIVFASGSEGKQLFAGGTIRKLQLLINAGGHTLPTDALQVDSQSGRAELTQRYASQQIGYAKLSVALPVRNRELLLGAGMDYPAEVKAEGLQLPSRTPKRIGKLAEAVTEGASTPLEKAERIEAFLKKTYAYSMSDALLPPAGEDFVDDFLFNRRVGYCDYFSTSMAVMLRTVGVPARWVKGFAAGELAKDSSVDSAADGTVQAAAGSGGSTFYTVTVRGKHAHSWVEVYFPGSGWIPFDPTPSAALSGAGVGSAAASTPQPAFTAEEEARFTAALQRLSAQGSAAPFSTQASRFLRDAVQERAGMLWRELSAAVQADKSPSAALHGRPLRMIAAAAALLALPGLAAAAAYVRQRAAPALGPLLPTRSRAGRRRALLQALDRCWQSVFRRYGAKPPTMTLRDYAGSLTDRHPHLADGVKELALYTEAVRFGGEAPPWTSRRRLHRLWKSIMRGQPLQSEAAPAAAPAPQQVQAAATPAPD